MMPIPSALSWPMISKSCCDSPAVRDLVGSSMMISRASIASALAISTICIWPAVRVETGVVGGRAKPTRLKQSPGDPAHLAAR